MALRRPEVARPGPRVPPPDPVPNLWPAGGVAATTAARLIGPGVLCRADPGLSCDARPDASPRVPPQPDGARQHLGRALLLQQPFYPGHAAQAVSSGTSDAHRGPPPTLLLSTGSPFQ